MHLKHRTPRILRFFRKQDVTESMRTSQTVDQATTVDQGTTPRAAINFKRSVELEVINDVQQEMTDPDIERSVEENTSELVMLGYQNGIRSTNYSVSSRNSKAVGQNVE